MAIRDFSTRRQNIVKALAEKLKGINGLGSFLTDVGQNVETRLKFWDEINTFPAIHLNSGSETREYLAHGQKTRFLTITIRLYVESEDAPLALDRLFEDTETVIESNSRLLYTDSQGNSQFTQQITIISIDTDEGVLEPLGVGEMLIEVRY
jgi:hypothetical protein|tara:strand:- start:91 stop:543 length:453 start_codon:yes stop_codon:yes gene_type:complete